MKKPAHEVLLKEIESLIDTFDATLKNKGLGTAMSVIVETIKISLVMDLLDKIIIPDKHANEVVEKLTRIKDGCSPKARELFFRKDLSRFLPATTTTNEPPQDPDIDPCDFVPTHT